MWSDLRLRKTTITKEMENNKKYYKMEWGINSRDHVSSPDRL